MRVLFGAGLLAGCSLVLVGGCGSNSESEPTTPDSSTDATSGGDNAYATVNSSQDHEDATTDANSPTLETPIGTDAGSVSDEPASNPWGETRAQQCQAPARHTVSASAARSIRNGIRSAASGETASAQTAFEQALSSDSHAFPAAYNLGVISDRAGHEARALDWYRRALQMQPDYEPALGGIATIFHRRNQDPEGLRAIEPVARQFPTNLRLQALYSEALTRAGRFDEAWAAARLALRCDERSVPALIAIVKASRGQGRDTLAERVLEQALEVDDGNAELHYLKAGLLEERPGRLNEALSELRRAIELRPDYAEAHTSLGMQLLAGAQYTEALNEFHAAMRLAPNVASVHVGLGNAYRAIEQWVEAKQAFDHALAINPNLPEIQFDVGLLYMAAGGDFPALDDVGAIQQAIASFTRYRNMMGSRLSQEDESEGYLRSLNRRLERTQARIERQRVEAERGARDGEKPS